MTVPTWNLQCDHQLVETVNEKSSKFMLSSFMISKLKVYHYQVSNVANTVLFEYDTNIFLESEDVHYLQKNVCDEVNIFLQMVYCK